MNKSKLRKRPKSNRFRIKTYRLIKKLETMNTNRNTKDGFQRYCDIMIFKSMIGLV